MTGVQHRFATALLIPSVVYGTYIVTGSHVLAACSGLGTLSGMALSPDLDIADNPRHFMHYVFFAYAKILKHRSFWSHAPVVGTIGRLLYLGLLAWPIWHFAGQPAINVNPLVALWAFIGLTLADTLHWVLDGFGLEKRGRK